MRSINQIAFFMLKCMQMNDMAAAAGGDFNMQHFLMYICKGKSCTYFRTLFYFLEHNIIIHKYAVS